MKVVIVIDGESAENICVVGSKDIAEFFLPKGNLRLVNKKDVKSVSIKEGNIFDNTYYEDLWERD